MCHVRRLIEDECLPLPELLFRQIDTWLTLPRQIGGELAVKIRSRWLNKLAVWLGIVGFRTLFATCRKVHLAPAERLTLKYIAGPDDPERFILCTWHDALVIPTFCSIKKVRQRTCCLVSRHQDGGYLADAMAILGYSTVRGSTSKGGAQALKQLLDDTAGKHIVITPDGPRGPRRELKPGAVYLASQTGRKICVGAYVCCRGWRIQGSWTDMLIPKPFTTIYLLTSEPIAVPPDLSREQLQHYVGVVQTALDDLNSEAERVLRGAAASTAAPAPSVRRAA